MSQPLAPGTRLYVAGHEGLVGSALLRRLRTAGHAPLTRTLAELDLTDQRATRAFFEAERPEAVFLAAAMVGNVQTQASRPADVLGLNLMIQQNVLAAAHAAGVQRLVFFGSAAIYPRTAPQPIHEAALLTGELEEANAYYAIAKIAGLKLCQAYNAQHGTRYVTLVPCNLYGPGDDFHPGRARVVPALLGKFHAARHHGTPVELWGTGAARRELLHVDDLAAAALFVLEHLPHAELVNVGPGTDVSLRELAAAAARTVGYEGPVQWDATKPEGAPAKLLDSTQLRAAGWRPELELQEGLEHTYAWFQAQPPRA